MAADVRGDSRFNPTFLHSLFQNSVVTELIMLACICQVILKIKVAPISLAHDVVSLDLATWNCWYDIP